MPTVIQMLCMFCGADLGTVDGKGVEGESHGACPGCIEREWGIDMSDVPVEEPHGDRLYTTA